MYCPEGFSLLVSLEDMAKQIAGSETVEPVREDYEDLNHYQLAIVDYFFDRDQIEWGVIDRFLTEFCDVWICSPEGQIFKLDSRAVYTDAEDYFASETIKDYRERHYPLVDLTTWTIDLAKPKRTRDFLKSINAYEANTWRRAENWERALRPFEGWALCISKNDFPTSPEKLKTQVLGRVKSYEAASMVQLILKRLDENEKITKSQVKMSFPHISERRFLHFWKLAAEVRPEISRPGPK